MVNFYGLTCISHSDTLKECNKGARNLSESDQRDLEIEIKEKKAHWVAFAESACQDYYEERLWVRLSCS